MADTRSDRRLDRWGWSWRVSLTARILAVNVIALALLAGSLFYIDSYRKELLAERFRLAASEAEITSHAMADRSRKQRRALMMQIGSGLQLRLRLYDDEGELEEDSFDLDEPSYTFVDPATEPFLRRAARVLDRGMDVLLGAPPIPEYADPDGPSATNWPELQEALDTDTTAIGLRIAPDRTPVIIAAAPVGDEGESLLITRNARDITENVRDARQTLAIIVGAALIISILLSLFLARTIVEPLRKLVRAAIRVRLGRDREVVVPRLPDRRDEIGLLARAVSDMSVALRERIDSVERFAADVAHELKNPLTSVRSALETLGKVDDPDVRRQLLEIASQDVRRVDFLVTEIADASRIDAELSRATFEPVNMDRLVRAIVAEREERGVNLDRRLFIACQGQGDTTVAGSPSRLERVLHNLIDNAVSFSPSDEPIVIELSRQEDRVIVSVSDAGPGIPENAREKVFERFHSLRPTSEEFGTHSGLGLAIARTIVEAHFGKLNAQDRADGTPGARLVLSLPAWEEDAA